MRSILVTGFVRQGLHVTRLLNTKAPGIRAVFYPTDRFSVVRCVTHATYGDAAISIGGPPHGFVRKICNARGRPAIILWVGTDVLEVAHAPHVLEPLRLENLVHWACAPHLVSELAALGIEARYVKIAGVETCTAAPPLPTTFTVLAYLPEPSREFYGQAHLWEAARALPDVRFVVVGRGGGESGAPANVQYAGEVNDMERRIDSASVLFRLPQHDGLPVMVIEALARGRHVIWTHPFPGVIQAASAAEAIDALVKLHDEHVAGVLSANDAGMRHAAHAHAASDVVRGILNALHDAAAHARQSELDSRNRCPRLAISGPEVLAARVASNCRKHSSGVAASLLTTRTGGDTAVSVLELAASDVWYTIGQTNVPRSFELAAILTRKRRLVHWLGNDADLLSSNPRLLQKYRSSRFEHFAQNSEVLDRLSEMGIPSRIAPLAVLPELKSIHPLPKTFTLLLYLPMEHEDFYGRFHYERLMRSLATEPVHYIIVGGGVIDVPPNVSADRLGWIHDLGDTYDRSTALVLFAQTDSVSSMAMEALLHARHVLCCDDLRFATRLRNYGGLEASVRALLAQHSDGALTPQIEASSAINAVYSPERCVGFLENALCNRAAYRTEPATLTV